MGFTEFAPYQRGQQVNSDNGDIYQPPQVGVLAIKKGNSFTVDGDVKPITDFTSHFYGVPEKDFPEVDPVLGEFKIGMGFWNFFTSVELTKKYISNPVAGDVSVIITLRYKDIETGEFKNFGEALGYEGTIDAQGTVIDKDDNFATGTIRLDYMPLKIVQPLTVRVDTLATSSAAVVRQQNAKIGFQKIGDFKIPLSW